VFICCGYVDFADGAFNKSRDRTTVNFAGGGDGKRIIWLADEDPKRLPQKSAKRK